MDLGQDHGQLHDLSSPILSKIQESFVMLRGSLAGETDDLFTDCISLDGKRPFTPDVTSQLAPDVQSFAPVGINKSTMYIGWNQASARLVLACKVVNKLCLVASQVIVFGFYLT